MIARLLGAALVGVALLACDNGAGMPGPDPYPNPSPSSGGLRFLHPAAGAPSLADRQVSFWAVRGQRREAALMYHALPGQTDSMEFAHFRVDAGSLVNRPDGTPIAMGDSILITLSVADTVRLIADFQPSGLVFSSSQPAWLWFNYAATDPDLDGDGSVTAADTTLLLGAQVQRQEQAGDPWVALGSMVDTVARGVGAYVPGFTRYAVAY